MQAKIRELTKVHYDLEYKLSIQEEMGRAKRSLLAVTSLVLSSFILFFQVITAAITTLGSPWGLLKQSVLHLIKVRKSLSQGIAEQYVQVIANSSISLVLAFAIANYQTQFIRILLFLSVEVHQQLLGVVIEVPQLSEKLQEWEPMRSGLYYSYFLFGFLGISAQCILTVDILALASLPIAFALRGSVKVLKTCAKLFIRIRLILATNRQGWMSCEYSQALLKESSKLFYLSSLPFLCFLMFGSSLYAAGLYLTLLAIRLASNVIINCALGLDQVGFILCLLKQASRKPQFQAAFWKQLQNKVKSINWVPLLTARIFWETLDGYWPLNESRSFLDAAGEGWDWARAKELLGVWRMGVSVRGCLYINN